MPPRFRAKVATTIGTVVLVGCSACPSDDDCVSPVATRTTSAAVRAHAVADRAPRIPRLAKRESKPTTRQSAGLLTPQNQAKFTVLPGTEMFGRSLTYNGEQLDADTCAEQCLADSGCDAFSFNTGTKVCYRVGQITTSNPNPSFVSGRRFDRNR